jgi:hypothetical protein
MALNPEKTKARYKRYREKNREKLLANGRRRYATHRNDMVVYRRKHATGFTAEMFASRIAAQNSKCAICYKDLGKDPCADHCHKTGKQRGVLCRKCNAMLGHAKDNPEILWGAVEYLLLRS